MSTPEIAIKELEKVITMETKEDLQKQLEGYTSLMKWAKEQAQKTEKELQELSFKLPLNKPCILVDEDEGNTPKALIYTKQGRIEGWQDPVGAYFYTNEKGNDNNWVVRYLNKDEIVEVASTGTTSDLGEKYDKELAKQCVEEEWEYLGTSSKVRNKLDGYKYEFFVQLTNSWKISTEQFRIISDRHYRKRLK